MGAAASEYLAPMLERTAEPPAESPRQAGAQGLVVDWGLG